MKKDSVKVRVYEVGEVYLWVEQESSIHIKAVTEYGDPVELTEEEARQLAEILRKLAKEIEV